MSADALDHTIDMKEAIERVLNKMLEPVVELESLRRMEYLNAEGIAKLFSLEKNTLNCQRSRGTGPPYIKIGSKILYSPDCVRRFMEQHRVKTSW